MEHTTNCQQIAHKAVYNLSMVAYTANEKSVTVLGDMTLVNLYSILESSIPSVGPTMGFNWDFDRGYTDNYVLGEDWICMIGYPYNSIVKKPHLR